MSDIIEAYRAPDDDGSPPRKPARFGLLKLLALIAIGFLLIGIFLPSSRSASEAARRMQCSNNLKQIALALQQYKVEYHSFPPVYVADADGVPMHSWRVLILPFLEQSALFEEYRFDEPWDGPNNIRLASQIPAVFRCPSFSPRNYAGLENDAESMWSTQYLAITGDNSSFPVARSKNSADIHTQDPSKLLVVELDSECVPWSAPRDIDLAGFARVLNNRSTKRVQHRGGVHVVTTDGAVFFVRDPTDLAALQRVGTMDP